MLLCYVPWNSENIMRIIDQEWSTKLFSQQDVLDDITGSQCTQSVCGIMWAVWLAVWSHDGSTLVIWKHPSPGWKSWNAPISKPVVNYVSRSITEKAASRQMTLSLLVVAPDHLSRDGVKWWNLQFWFRIICFAHDGLLQRNDHLLVIMWSQSFDQPFLSPMMVKKIIKS